MSGWAAAAQIGGELAGAWLGSESSRKANNASKKIAREQMALQKEFAQNGIRWKVADAKAAGLHPLAALGANTISYTPQAVGIDATNHWGNALSNMGQDVSRAIQAHQSKAERAQELQKAEDYNNKRMQLDIDRQALDVEKHKRDIANMDLQNELLKSQLARARSAQLGPGMPSTTALPRSGGRIVADVTSPSGAVEVNPSQITAARPGEPSLEAGATPGFKEYRIGGKNLGFNAELPAASSSSEAFESSGELLAPAYILTHNVLRGAEWLWNKYYDRGKKTPRQTNYNRAGRY